MVNFHELQNKVIHSVFIRTRREYNFVFRNDGSVNTAISLPTDSPFILLKYEPTCQTVYGMTVTELFIYWDDDNELNTSFSEGKHPLDTGGYDDHLLHFCYYSSTTTV